MNVPMIFIAFPDRAVALYGEKDAVHCEGRTITYEQLNE